MNVAGDGLSSRADSEPGTSIRHISAVTLLTSDMRAAVAFYQALGFDLRYGGGDQPFSSFTVGSGYLNLQLDPGGPVRRPPWGRVIIYVDDVDAMHRRATGCGFRSETSPADAPWGERYFHIRDPDDHELSFARPIHGQGE